MNGYTGAIENETNANTDFRRVLYTSKNSQLVLMSLLPGVFEKIRSVKLGRYEKKLAKEAQKIVKYKHKIEDLKEKMSKIHRAQAV